MKLNTFILVYLDDILVFSNTIEEHWEHLRVALRRLKEAKLYTDGCINAISSRIALITSVLRSVQKVCMLVLKR